MGRPDEDEVPVLRDVFIARADILSVDEDEREHEVWSGCRFLAGK